MKKIKEISLIILGVMILPVFSSCDKIKESLSFNIPIKPAPIEIVIENPIPRSADSETVLYETTFNTNLNNILSQNNYSLDNLKAFNFEKAEIKATEPTDFDMSHFIGLKIYFGDPQELVAKAARVSDDKKTLYFDIVQKDVLKYAKNDSVPLVIKIPELPRTSLIRLLLELEFSATIKL